MQDQHPSKPSQPIEISDEPDEIVIDSNDSYGEEGESEVEELLMKEETQIKTEEEVKPQTQPAIVPNADFTAYCQRRFGELI